MRFVKMQGLGNDFVVIESVMVPEPDAVARICDRHRGIGADGLLVVSRSGDDIEMGYWNSDGSPAEMCGNGLRCVARFALDRGLVNGSEFDVLTPAGRRQVRVVSDGRIEAEIGTAWVEGEVQVDGASFTRVDVGNPHAVTIVDDPESVNVETRGRDLQGHPEFPQGVNVEFVALEGRDAIRLRVWERGVGETLACGTGMVAAAAVARAQAGADRITVHVPGGSAEVRFVGDTGWLTGPAEYVFEGEWPQGL